MGRLALFDLDDTLIALAPAFRRFAADFVRARALPEGAEEWLVAQWDPYQRREAYFAVVRERFELTESAQDLWREYRRAMPGFVVLRDEVRDGLAALRRAGWRLGIVTNGEADNQLGKIERTGLDLLVDAAAVSGALGVRKPEAGIFRYAAESAGCALEDGGWMVGDNLAYDVGGGAGVGLRTVWVDAAGASTSTAGTIAGAGTEGASTAAAAAATAGSAPMAPESAAVLATAPAPHSATAPATVPATATAPVTAPAVSRTTASADTTELSSVTPDVVVGDVVEAIRMLLDGGPAA